MSRVTKVIEFSVPPTIAEEVEQIAQEERRTKSELFREMVRVYQWYRQHQKRDEDRWIMDLIREAEEEQAREPMTIEEKLKESEELARYGAQQAKKLGIKPEDIDRIIHAHRARQRP